MAHTHPSLDFAAVPAGEGVDPLHAPCAHPEG
jgi:hypothetical protein